MSNPNVQSLDENAVFLPLTESSPEFLHSEGERNAVESLIHDGTEAFSTCLKDELLGQFLSPAEVNQISDWAEEYHISQLQSAQEDHAEDNPDTRHLSDRYFPTFSDTPAPWLELGWPDSNVWVGGGCATVYTNPPAEGQPPIREIIRRHLQGASQVIAIVTDRLTDTTIIGDLHNAASRGVPVYIIMNQRSIHDNFTPNAFKHPNMRVRVLGGKTFCSRKGKMVVGELKDNFILVDLETVIHGSYSLTWTDAHLHRQLITVLSGPVLDSFDREFRILFAASLSISDALGAIRSREDGPSEAKDLSIIPRCPERFPLELVTSPPPPPTDSPLDWDVLRSRQGLHLLNGPISKHEEIKAIERSPLNTTLFDKKRPVVDEFACNRNQPMNGSSNAQPFPTDGHYSTGMDIQQRLGQKVGQVCSRQLSTDHSTDADDRTMVRPGEDTRELNLRRDLLPMSSMQRSTREKIVEEQEANLDGFPSESSPSEEGAASSRQKPVILRVRYSETFSSLSDIMKRLSQSPATPLKGGPKTAVSELSRSMMDLSVQKMNTHQEERGRTVPRLHASYFDPNRETPGLAVMKKRNDEIKTGAHKSPIQFLPNSFSHSPSYVYPTDWSRPRADRERGHREFK